MCWSLRPYPASGAEARNFPADFALRDRARGYGILRRAFDLGWVEAEFVANHGVREDEAGGRDTVVEQLQDEVLEFFDGGDQDLHHQGVGAGDVVTLPDGLQGLDELEELTVFFAVADHADVGFDAITERGGVDFHAVAADDAGLFEATNALGGG